MPTKKQLSRAFRKYYKKIGRLAGAPVNVYRPDYTAQDNIPELVREEVDYRIDTGAEKFLEVAFARVQAFDTFGPIKGLQPGDMLFDGSPEEPGLTKGPFTIVHWDEIKPMVAIKTGRRANIAVSQDEDTGEYTYLHKNIYFGLVTPGFPNGSLTKPFDSGGTPIATDQMILFFRQALTNPDYSNLKIIEVNDDGTLNGRKWSIDQVDWEGPLMVVKVRRDF